MQVHFCLIDDWVASTNSTVGVKSRGLDLSAVVKRSHEIESLMHALACLARPTTLP